MLQLLRRYHFRWCLVLIIITGGTSLLPRLGNITPMQMVVHLVPAVLFLTISWLIHAYFKISYQGPLPRKARVAVSIGLCTAVIALLSLAERCIVPPYLLPPGSITGSGFQDILQLTVISFFLSMISYTVLNTVVTSNLLQKTQLENERLKQADLRVRLSSLQQQISPHFLFNSLSTLKTIAKDTETKDFIIKLSHVYRYLLSFNEVHLATVQQELKFIDAYIYILHERFDDALQVHINIPEKYFDYKVPPLSLQLLIENAIKHNAFSPDEPLQIAVAVDAEERLTVTNNLRPKNLPEPSTRLGLQNINDRCMLLTNQPINVVTTETTFTVIIPIVHHEHSDH